MKTIYLALIAMLLAAPVFAQDGDRAPDSMADSLLTKKQAETRINEWRLKVKALQDKADALSAEKTQNEQRLALAEIPVGFGGVAGCGRGTAGLLRRGETGRGIVR